jgi:hypothetical protein
MTGSDETQDTPAATATRGMTAAELLGLPAVTDLKTAARAWGIGLTKAAGLAREDKFMCPVRRVGRCWKVRKVDLFASLGLNLDGTPITEPREVA